MLTPEEIQSREFLVSLRGYDRDEVDAFLDDVAGEFATLLAMTRGGAAPAAEPADDAPDTPAVEEPEPEEPAQEPAPEPAPQPASDVSASFAAIGAETQRILEAAHAAGEQIRAQAQAEADEVSRARLEEVQGEVDALREEAAAVRRQIDDLTARREDLVLRLRQAKETVELALVEAESDDDAPAEPADPSNSVLAAEAAGTGAASAEAEPDVDDPEDADDEDADAEE